MQTLLKKSTFPFPGLRPGSHLRLPLVLYLAVCIATITGCATFGTSSSHGIDFTPDEHGVTEFMLNNGMKVIVKEDRRSPMSVVQIWYRIGSNDERGGLTGISHALEHMMFKGTPKYPAEKLTQTIKREGGRYNAFTGSNYTAYYEVFEKSRMPISFQIESDRMVNLVLREEDFEKEIEVVKEERRLRVEDKPNSRLNEQLYATAFNSSPSGQPVIGWMDDLNNMTLDDLKVWYRLWYAPNNAVLVVAGDVNPEEVHRLATRYMAPLKPITLPKHKPQREPAQHGERRVVMKLPAERPRLNMGYRVPAVGSADEPWEPYALKVLATALSGGGDARFAKRLVRGKKIAQHAGAGYSLYNRHDGLFTISAEPVKGTEIEELEAAIVEEIEAVKQDGVSAEELSRIKAKTYANEIYGRDSITRQAYTLGALETIGVGWRAAYELFDHIKQVTPEQVQAVARKYLIKDHRTVAVLDPQPINPQPANQASE